jgi:hypothetical protein
MAVSMIDIFPGRIDALAQYLAYAASTLTPTPSNPLGNETALQIFAEKVEEMWQNLQTNRKFSPIYS